MINLSIVIPTKGRVKHVEKLLRLLLIEDESIEIIILDDSSTMESKRIENFVNKIKNGHFFRLNKNVSEKRNYGAEIATSPIVLFLDSDCYPNQGLLKEHLSFWHNPPADAIALLGVLEFSGKENFIFKVIQQTELLKPFLWAKEKDSVSWGPTANLSVLRESFLKIGGFNSKMSPPLSGGEDVEFGLRANNHGLKTYCNANAIVFHTTETWLSTKSIIQRLWIWGKGDIALFLAFPENLKSNPLPLLVMSVFVILISLLVYTIEFNFFFFSLFPIWLFFTFLFYLIWGLIKSRSFYYGFTPFIYSFLDFSRIYNAKLKHKFLMLKRFGYNDDDLYEWNDIGIGQCLHILSLLISLIVITLFA
jgi:glycosyltransferase involved in cell wall biosynthesis